MSVISTRQVEQGKQSVAQYDAVVVGAGPYGLSVTAHLRGKGLNVAIQGKPIELWREHMPEGMRLRSHWWATNLTDPQKRFTFKRFLEMKGYPQTYPTELAYFIEYAQWFQENVVPDVDETYVSEIVRHDGVYSVTLVDGRILQAPVVVMAIGVYYYANVPEEYASFSPELVSHSFEYADFSRFVGKRLAIVGGGQSAVENATLAGEEGADVSLIARHPIYWLAPDRSYERTLLEKLRAPNSGIAPGWPNWGLEHFPYLFQRLGQKFKNTYVQESNVIGASDWLLERAKSHVHIYENCQIEHIEPQDHGCVLTLSNGKQLEIDHIMLATGYRVDVKKLPMLSSSLTAQINTTEDAPILNPWFESNVPGLYFVGLSSLNSFGPLYRFVVGATAAAPRVAQSVARYVRHRKGSVAAHK